MRTGVRDETSLVDLGLARSVAVDGRPRIRLRVPTGRDAAADRRADRLGLFSEIAGLLAAHGCPIRSAALNTVEGVAVNTWRVDKQVAADLPDPAYLVKQLERLEAGDPHRPAVGTAPRARGSSRAVRPTPYVELVADASASAAVVEVRAGDRSGLLYALGRAVSGAERLSIRSAHVSTLAGQAIDTFYLTEADGSPPRRRGPSGPSRC